MRCWLANYLKHIQLLLFQTLLYLQNCVTHGKDFEETTKIEMEWKAPSVSVGDIIFSASVIKDFETYWVNHTGYLTAVSPMNASAVDKQILVSSSANTQLL